MELGDRYLVVQRAALGANPLKHGPPGSGIGFDQQALAGMGMSMNGPSFNAGGMNMNGMNGMGGMGGMMGNMNGGQHQQHQQQQHQQQQD